MGRDLDGGLRNVEEPPGEEFLWFAPKLGVPINMPVKRDDHGFGGKFEPADRGALFRPVGDTHGNHGFGPHHLQYECLKALPIFTKCERQPNLDLPLLPVRELELYRQLRPSRRTLTSGLTSEPLGDLALDKGTPGPTAPSSMSCRSRPRRRPRTGSGVGRRCTMTLSESHFFKIIFNAFLRESGLIRQVPVSPLPLLLAEGAHQVVGGVEVVRVGDVLHGAGRLRDDAVVLDVGLHDTLLDRLQKIML